MKILLIQPNASEEVDKEYVSLQFPINLGYIASVLREAGHEIKMLDFNVTPKEELDRHILEFQPSIVGMTAMTSSIINVKSIIENIKTTDKNLITVLGGVHASALPAETMKDIEDLDYLIFGEGEMTILELANYLENKTKELESIKGIVFRIKDRIIKTGMRELIENLDKIPPPARDLLPMELYAKRHVSRGFSRKHLKIIEIMTSRGCPNQCIFCAGHINYGYKLRFRSYENIISEVQQCINQYGITHISIEDDTFTINKELVKQLCAFFKEKGITWNCNARVNTVNYELLKIMANSGCEKIAYGIESGSPEILLKNKKGITIAQALNAVSETKKASIRYVECDFMIGSHIDETLDDVKLTKKLINQLMPDFLAVSIMCPYPGTELYKMMIKNNYLPEKPDWSQFSHFGDLKRYERLKYLSSSQMSKMQNEILKQYYSSPKYILMQLSKIRTFNEIKYFSKLGAEFLREIF